MIKNRTWTFVAITIKDADDLKKKIKTRPGINEYVDTTVIQSCILKFIENKFSVEYNGLFKS